MADLSKLSDQDLLALHEGNLSKMSDEGLLALHSQVSQVNDQGGADHPVLDALKGVAKTFDAYTGAPSRAAIGAAQDVGSLNPVEWAKAGGSAFLKQIGENPDAAPTGEDLVKKTGVPEGPLAKTLGFGMDMAANPLNFTGPALSMAGKAVNASREIPYAGAAIGKMADFPGQAATWATSKVTRVPEKAVELYSKDAGPINQFIQDTGGEFSAGADKMKQSIIDAVQEKKNLAAEQITKALDAAAPEPVASSKVLLDPLFKAQSQVNKHTNPAAWKHIQNQIDTINNVAPEGALNLRQIFDVKNYLQDQRYGTIRQTNGDLFLVADEAKKAAGQSLHEATQILHKQAPAIRDADQFYSQLHDIDNTMNTGLLSQGKSEDIFASAGGATQKYGNQHYTALKKVDDLIGTEGVKDAETVYAARSLNKTPSITKEIFKTEESIRQAVMDSRIPGRTYNATQALGVPDSPVNKKDQNAIDRKLASQKK